MTGTENDFKKFCTDCKGKMKKIDLPFNKLPKGWRRIIENFKCTYQTKKCINCKEVQISIEWKRH